MFGQASLQELVATRILSLLQRTVTLSFTFKLSDTPIGSPAAAESITPAPSSER